MVFDITQGTLKDKPDDFFAKLTKANQDKRERTIKHILYKRREMADERADAHEGPIEDLAASNTAPWRHMQDLDGKYQTKNRSDYTIIKEGRKRPSL